MANAGWRGSVSIFSASFAAWVGLVFLGVVPPVVLELLVPEGSILTFLWALDPVAVLLVPLPVVEKVSLALEPDLLPPLPLPLLPPLPPLSPPSPLLPRVIMVDMKGSLFVVMIVGLEG